MKKLWVAKRLLPSCVDVNASNHEGLLLLVVPSSDDINYRSLHNQLSKILQRDELIRSYLRGSVGQGRM